VRLLFFCKEIVHVLLENIAFYSLLVITAIITATLMIASERQRPVLK